MQTQVELEELLDQLQDVLVRLSYEGYDPLGSCFACGQYVDTHYHLPSCIISRALIAIEEWRE